MEKYSLFYHRKRSRNGKNRFGSVIKKRGLSKKNIFDSPIIQLLCRRHENHYLNQFLVLKRAKTGLIEASNAFGKGQKLKKGIFGQPQK
jgi:hypothetical protein